MSFGDLLAYFQCSPRLSVPSLQDDASQEFMARFLIPKASSAGAKVITTMLHSDPDSSNDIAAAICGYVKKHKPAALLMMKHNKSALTRFFLGSVTRYCAIHCHTSVIIVPA